MATEPRHWRMHAGRDARHDGYRHFGDPRTVQAYGDAPVEVELVEDSEGTYWGWMHFAHDHYPASDAPVMVQPHKSLFNMQFPHGPDAEVNRGHGEVVRCSVHEVANA